MTGGAADSPLPQSIDELSTPALLLDLDRLEANLAGMQALADRLGVALRPHAKTHKCRQVARRQREAGARGLTVSTLYEAEYFAGDGWDDLTWAFPLILGRIGQARRLAERVTLRLVVDSQEAVAALAAERFPFHVFLKVDSGYGRAGVDPDSDHALGLARRIAGSPHLVLDGLLSHSGHAYHAASRGEARAAALEERERIVGLAERLRGEGIEVPAVSVGSTPSMAALGAVPENPVPENPVPEDPVPEDTVPENAVPEDTVPEGASPLAGVTEVRPGNYVFHDGTQAALGSCSPADCAVTVLASVVSSQPGGDHAVIDAGALALSKDAGPDHLPGGYRWAMGAVFPDAGSYRAGRPAEELVVTSLSQEHGRLSRPRPVGERLRVLPNHSCLAVPNFPYYWVVRGETVVDRWEIAGGRN